MCARYTMTKVSPDELAAELGVHETASALEPRFNIAPTEEAPIVVESREGARHLGLARFGLVPHWAKDLKVGTRMLNARVETVAEKPAFRDAFVRHRCLVPADGFFEWRREGKLKIPHWFHLPDRHLFAFAGLYAVWRDAKGERVTSFAIVTRPAEGSSLELHDRMPVVLSRDAYASWLDRSRTTPEEIRPLLDRHRALELEGWEVSRRVNAVASDDPSLIEPVAGRAAQSAFAQQRKPVE